ncbi:2-oxo acid dehydrogenase subunit E2 [Noviherbaspirillum sedimenti]|uniref:Dihydrolipoyllysine-residue acetyltransferase component of pyruvate dehydrogenase complex n=1 Tax=Noviherbaspirillum sedimenti TaxID=2320865 RepID=A0A3A3G0B7_9BURK|nr:2-oxo acid dehydrogenase subunit E2 [Noviherbaspirillum sedimenti]RJG01364.1 dihydrolipoamide acetyltransferase [Noviherbaspirillum sedimenti]
MNDITSTSFRLDLPPWPVVDFAEFGEVEIMPLSRIQALTAGYLSRNSVAIPHVTHHDELDITELEALRKRLGSEFGTKLTLLPFVAKAVAMLLVKFPKFNASLDATGRNLVLKKYFHIGVAIDTPAGLLVAVLRDCERKSISQLADELTAISAKAKAKGLAMKEMVGGCMTISSLGHIGGTAFTPIVNAPEVAILGVTRAQWKPRRSDDGAIEWRLMLPVSLSYDHRVINGADAARFCLGLGSELLRLGTQDEVGAR